MPVPSLDVYRITNTTAPVHIMRLKFALTAAAALLLFEASASAEMVISVTSGPESSQPETVQSEVTVGAPFRITPVDIGHPRPPAAVSDDSTARVPRLLIGGSNEVSSPDPQAPFFLVVNSGS